VICVTFQKIVLHLGDASFFAQALVFIEEIANAPHREGPLGRRRLCQEN
jgi:hypothetical protein